MTPELQNKIIHHIRQINPELTGVYVEDILSWLTYFLADPDIVWEAFGEIWEKYNK